VPKRGANGVRASASNFEEYEDNKESCVYLKGIESKTEKLNQFMLEFKPELLITIIALCVGLFIMAMTKFLFIKRYSRRVCFVYAFILTCVSIGYFISPIIIGRHLRYFSDSMLCILVSLGLGLVYGTYRTWDMVISNRKNKEEEAAKGGEQKGNNQRGQPGIWSKPKGGANRRG
jgi:hypothetical protein